MFVLVKHHLSSLANNFQKILLSYEEEKGGLLDQKWGVKKKKAIFTWKPRCAAKKGVIMLCYITLWSLNQVRNSIIIHCEPVMGMGARCPSCVYSWGWEQHTAVLLWYCCGIVVLHNKWETTAWQSRGWGTLRPTGRVLSAKGWSPISLSAEWALTQKLLPFQAEKQNDRMAAAVVKTRRTLPTVIPWP